MSHSLNTTVVVLIPKVSNPEDRGHFKPISLCCFVYQIISEILENHL